MFRIGVVLAGLAAALLLVSDGQGQSGDKDKDKPKTKTKLPLYWGQLKLSPEQKKSVETVRKTFAKKLDELKKQEQEELLRILTPDQRTELRRIIAAKAGLENPPPKDGKKGDSKDKDKKGG
jgi:hypothetical protein